MAQPPAVAVQVESVAPPAFLALPRLPLYFSLDREQLPALDLATRPFAVGFRLQPSADPDLSFHNFWYGGTRDATLRDVSTRARSLRGAAAGIAMTGGLAMMLGGGVKGGRRSGRAGTAPIVNAGSHTGADLGVVMGSGVLFTSVLMASLPLEGGVRRMRPMPIGGKRWGGMAARWRF